MSEKKAVACKNCKSWIENEYSSDVGFCHGGPPTADPRNTQRAIWPVTKADEWCARFELRRWK